MALQAVINPKMRSDTLVGESRADEPGLGPCGTCPEGQAISECRLQIGRRATRFCPTVRLVGEWEGWKVRPPGLDAP
jgi:hypothetical protein